MSDRALTDADYLAAAVALDCDVAAIKAVAEVEAPRGGFIPDGRPTVLFEGHLFYAETKGKYKDTAPTLCYPKWTRQWYAKTQEGEHARVEQAAKLDRPAALKSTSWGRFQILGRNFKACHYPNVEAFVAAMHLDERHQLDAFVAFLQTNSLDAPLREGQWAVFARGYNGPRYAENRYDAKLAAAFRKHSGG